MQCKIFLKLQVKSYFWVQPKTLDYLYSKLCNTGVRMVYPYMKTKKIKMGHVS